MRSWKISVKVKKHSGQLETTNLLRKEIKNFRSFLTRAGQKMEKKSSQHAAQLSGSPPISSKTFPSLQY